MGLSSRPLVFPSMTLAAAVCLLLFAVSLAQPQGGCPTPPPQTVVPSVLPPASQAALQALIKQLDGLAASSGATGAAATITIGKQQVLNYTYGNTTAGGGTPVTSDSIFRIGRQAHPVTVVASSVLGFALCISTQSRDSLPRSPLFVSSALWFRDCSRDMH